MAQYTRIAYTLQAYRSELGRVIAIGAIALTGSVETTWAFSAFTVLIYSAVTNFAALQLPKEARLYPRAFPIGGLIGCLLLAFWVPPHIWLVGSGLLALGLGWHVWARARKPHL
jgi:APA family basic amino acid/polyamine antiporter